MQANRFTFDYNKPRALVLDDHTLFTQSFGAYLEKLSIFRSVHCFRKDDDLISFLVRLAQGGPVICFIDFYLQDKTSLSLLNTLKQIYKPLHLVVVSSIENPVLIREVLQYRVDGFVSKNSGMDEIALCITAILKGKQFVAPFIRGILQNNPEKVIAPLTAKEIEVLSYLAKGLNTIEVAEIMCLSRHTVVAHKRNMMTKAKTNTLAGLLDYARTLQII